MKILIYTPPFRDNSAGIRVLRKLMEMLTKAGHEVDSGTHLKSANDQVHVIPDIVDRATIQSEMVVRYALAPPRLHGLGDHVFQEPVVFTWLKKYCPEAVEFHIDVLDRDIFYNQNTTRCFESVYNLGRVNHPKIPGHVCITQGWPNDRVVLAKLFNSTQTFYSYDRETLLNYEAKECGCKVIVMESGEFTPFNESLPIPTPLKSFTDPIKKAFNL